MTITDLRELCHDDTIMMTAHVVIKCRERGIKYNDIITAIMSGEVIEDYPNDYPFPSCLVLGKTICLHVVAGIGDNKLWVITAYFPSLDKWEADYKTRKAVQK